MSSNDRPVGRCVAIIALMVASVAVFVAPSAGAAPSGGSDAPTASAPPPNASVLGVIEAAKGRFDGRRLSLTKVQPNAVWFTDRPIRKAGTFDIDQLLEVLFTGDDPPNAALEFVTAPAERDVVIVELTRPRYDRTAGTLSFATTLVGADDVRARVRHPALRDFRSRADAKIPDHFGAVVAFVDAAAASASGDDEAIVQALESRESTLDDDLQAAITNTESQLQKDPSCLERVLVELDGWYDQVLDLDPQIQQVATATASNGGTIPPSDLDLVKTLDDTLAQLQQELDDLYTALGNYAASNDTLPCPVAP
jgi:hypothetical protein